MLPFFKSSRKLALVCLVSGLLTTAFAIADTQLDSKKFSVAEIENQQFIVPEVSYVSSRVEKDGSPQQITLLSPLKGSTLMVNYRKPYLHADLKNVLEKADISLEQINKVFAMGDAQFEDYHVVANFSHGFEGYNQAFMRPTTTDDKAIFWYAIVPKTSRVLSAGVQVEWFVEGIGNHMQIHYSLDKNILLLPMNLEDLAASTGSFSVEDRTQVEGNSPVKWIDIFGNNQKPVLIRGELVYALMGLKAYNGPQEFSFVNGITGNLIIGLTLASKGHMATDQMSRGSFIEEYQLKLSSEELQRTFDFVLLQNTDANPTANIYNTVFQNCIKEVVKAVDYGIEGRKGQLQFDADQFNPYSVPQYLISKDLVEKTPAKLNLEFAFYEKSGVNQTRETKENKATIAKVDKALKIIQQENLDTFVRQFAYEAAVNKWKQESINIYFSIMGEKISTIKVLEQFKIIEFMEKERELRNSQHKDEIGQIDAKIKEIIKGILTANLVSAPKNLVEKFVGVVTSHFRDSNSPTIEPEVFGAYLDVLKFMSSIKREKNKQVVQ
jgi:hypothetical protein